VNSATCSENVPFQDFSGGTGCANQGVGTCDYAAVVVAVGTNGPPVAEADISISWTAKFRRSIEKVREQSIFMTVAYLRDWLTTRPRRFSTKFQ
jgi:hypothetical protein